MRIVALFIFAFVLLAGCVRIKRDHRIEIEYPDEQPQSDVAEMFAPDLISTDSIEHSSPSFSPDGKRVLWSVMQMPTYKAVIFEMTFAGGSWSKPHVAPFADTSASDIYPTFSHDGTMLYFSSSRKLPSGVIPPRGNMLWRVRLEGETWSTPELLDSIISIGGDYAPSLSETGHLYFTHGPFRSPDWNIVAVDKTSTPAKFMPLEQINTPGYEDGAFIAPDNSYLIFESDRPGGVDGSIDLWISFRLESDVWTAPVNMGPKINTDATERFAKVSPDKNYLFFGSDRRKVNGKPNMDIYWIEATVIQELKELSLSAR